MAREARRMTNKPDGGMKERLQSQDFVRLAANPHLHDDIIRFAHEAAAAMRETCTRHSHQEFVPLIGWKCECGAILAKDFPTDTDARTAHKQHIRSLGPPEVQAAMEARDERIRQETISAHHHDIMEAAQSPITEDERKQIEQQAAANALEAAARDLGELADKYESGSYGEHYLKMAISNIRALAPDIAAKAKEHDAKIRREAYLRCAWAAHEPGNDVLLALDTKFRQWANEADGGG